MAGWLAARNVNFVSLRSAIFCVQCELISENSTPYCLACGSQALLSLSRILGGSLRDQQTAHLIADAELDRLVRELLRTIPPPQPVVAKKGVSRDVAGYVSPTPFSRGAAARCFSSDVASLAPGRHHLRIKHVGFRGETDVRIFSDAGELDLEPEISIIAERAQALTGATGARDRLPRPHRPHRTRSRCAARDKFWPFRRMCTHRGSSALRGCGNQPMCRPGKLPPPWCPVDSCRALASFPQDPGSF